ncbi:MAG: tetratricopeptide repeat protein [Steroidobacteraceae bacterium]
MNWSAVITVAAISSILCAPCAIGHDREHPASLGTVNFPVSCTPDAQQLFNTAASILYSFYWERVDAAVADVLATDPDCAMAYWVKAVASLDNSLGSPPTPQKEREGWAAVQKARALGAKSERERDYIGAVETVFRDHDTVPFKARAAAYEKALERLHLRYPEDSEAAVLYAFWLQVTADRNDQTYAQQLKSARILEKVYAAQPQHPGAAHFLIHAYDFPAIAEHGVDAARHYASIAPDSPHALHMPSHIFSRVGQWQDSIDTNRRSRAASKQDRDAYHALDYMVYASLQLGRDEQVREWVEFVLTAPKPNEETRQIAYAAAAIPARFALERGDWREAAKLALRPQPAEFDWKPFPEGEAVNAYARGLGTARDGNAESAKSEIARLAELRAAMTAQKKDYWIEQANIQIDTVTAWVARAEGRNDVALELMRAAAEREDRTEEHIMMPGRVIPVREMLGELLLDLKESALALGAFEQALRADPNRLRSLYGAARSAELSGDREKATQLYSQLLQQTGPQASDREELRHARTFVANR